jgi:hypothetical protein
MSDRPTGIAHRLCAEKKNRPGVVLSGHCEPETAQRAADRFSAVQVHAEDRVKN